MKGIIYGIIDREDDSILYDTLNKDKKIVDNDCKSRQTKDVRYYTAKFGLKQLKFI